MAPPRQSAPHGRTRGRFATAFQYLVYAMVLGLLGLIVAVAVAVASLPGYDQLSKRSDLGQMIRVRSSNGTVLVSLGPSFGQWLRYDEIPPQMRAAMIAVEDKRFRSHIGVDPIGVARSVKVRIESGRWRQGGSTITQQLARNIFLTNSRTFGRKVKEGVLALALERKFSKDQILELYLNRVYFGGGAYGIDAASRRFFGHSADNLTLGESAIIAGLVKAPSNYSPTADAEAARRRSGVVLKSMVDNGFVSASAAASVDPAKIRLQPTSKQNSVRYFTDWALPQLDTLIDETSEPIDVWTTLDTSMQAAADRAISRQCPARGARRAGRARPRRRGAGDGRRARLCRFALQSRDPGRAPAGLGLQAVRLSRRARIRHEADRHDRRRAGRRSTAGARATRPAPTSGRSRFARPFRARSTRSAPRSARSSASGRSPTWPAGSASAATSRPIPSMVLGTSDVRLIDMTRAFASVANRGVSVTPYAVRKVVTADGRLLYQHEQDEERVLVAPWVAAEMTDLLQSAVLTGTGRAAQIGRPVAGKTGTTSSNKDGWFIGFSSGITTGVWMGRDDARPIAGLAGRNRAGARVPRFHGRRRRPPPGRAVRDRGADARLAARARRRSCGASDRMKLGIEPLVDADGNPLPAPDGVTGDPGAVRPDGTGAGRSHGSTT